MIPRADATADTMRRALAFSIAALDAAAELDQTLSDEDRAFFSDEKATLQPLLDNLLAAQQALDQHNLKESLRLQARVQLGDSALDRSVRSAKARMKLELQNKQPGAADFVFGANLNDIVDADLRSEPSLVLGCVVRFEQVPDFPGKENLKFDLEGHANRQMMVLADRDAGDLRLATLTGSMARVLIDASETLYRLHKRMLDRFPRERTYVRNFFLDVDRSVRKKKADPPTS